MSDDNSIFRKLGSMPKVDALAVAALGLNSYVIYSQSSYMSPSQLMEPLAGRKVTVLQLSLAMAAVYIIDYMGDESDSSSHRTYNDETEGFTEWFAQFVDTNWIVDIASIGVVFLGFQTVQSMAGYGISLFEFSTDIVVVSMQLSLMMMLNFGLQLIGDFKD